MPTYAYRCDECGLTAEERHRIGHNPERIECPVCLGEARRTFTAPAVIVK